MLDEHTKQKYNLIINNFVQSIDFTYIFIISKRFLTIVLSKYIFNVLNKYIDDITINNMIVSDNERLNKVITFVNQKFNSHELGHLATGNYTKLIFDLNELKDDIYLYKSYTDDSKIQKELDTIFLNNLIKDESYDSSEFKNKLNRFNELLTQLKPYIKNGAIKRILIDEIVNIRLSFDFYSLHIKIDVHQTNDKSTFSVTVKDLLTYSLVNIDQATEVKNGFVYMIYSSYQAASANDIICINNNNALSDRKNEHGIEQINDVVISLIETELENRIKTLIDKSILSEICDSNTINIETFYPHLNTTVDLTIKNIINNLRSIINEKDNFRNMINSYRDDDDDYIKFEISDEIYIHICDNGTIFVSFGYNERHSVYLCQDGDTNVNLDEQMSFSLTEHFFKDNNTINLAMKLHIQDKRLQQLVSDLIEYCVKKYANP